MVGLRQRRRPSTLLKDLDKNGRHADLIARRLAEENVEKLPTEGVRDQTELVEVAEENFWLGEHRVALHLDLLQRLHEDVLEDHEVLGEEEQVGLKELPEGLATALLPFGDVHAAAAVAVTVHVPVAAQLLLRHMGLAASRRLGGGGVGATAPSSTSSNGRRVRQLRRLSWLPPG